MTAFNDPEVVRLLTQRFVPVATDYRDNKRKDADGAFFRKVTGPIPYRQSGACVFTADGQVLGAASATSKAEVVQLVRSALKKFRPPDRPYVIEPAGAVDDKNHRVPGPPEGGLVVSCIMTHLDDKGVGYYPGEFQKLLSQVAGVDRLWIRKDEAEALAGGRFPQTLKHRIARWHLIDNNFFGQNSAASVKQFDIDLRGGRLTGSVRIESGSSSLRLDL